MEDIKNALVAGARTGAYYAGVIAPIAAVIVVASWFKSSK